MYLCGSTFLFVCAANQNFLFRLFGYKIIILSRVVKRIDIWWSQSFINHAGKFRNRRFLSVKVYFTSYFPLSRTESTLNLLTVLSFVCQCASYQLLSCKTNVNEIMYERYSTGSFTKVLFIISWIGDKIFRTHKFIKWDTLRGLLLLLLLLLLFTAIEFSLGGSSPYTSNK